MKFLRTMDFTFSTSFHGNVPRIKKYQIQRNQTLRVTSRAAVSRHLAFILQLSETLRPLKKFQSSNDTPNCKTFFMILMSYVTGLFIPLC